MILRALFMACKALAVDLSTIGGDQFEKGFPGQVADFTDAVIHSRINEGATAIPFGRAVAKGASDGCIIMSAQAYSVAGISVKNVIHPRSTGGVVAYNQYDSVGLLTHGAIYVLAAENARDGDAVIAIVAGGGTLGSSQGGVADESDRITVPGAYWRGAVTAGSIGKIVLRGSGATIRTTT